ncbi:MAG TPA: FGGY family carbohydrate kinase, partial [Chloroflexota bacterium]|nr:FGGY family carbohydrate kinase [Chloroflexota bacterium]
MERAPRPATPGASRLPTPIAEDGPLLAGLDLGTTSIKAGVYGPDGRSLAQASVATPVAHPRPGWATHEAEAIWQCAAAVLRQATAQLKAQGLDPRRVAGVAVASMGEAGVLLDAQGRPCSEVIAWYDGRTQDQAAWLEREVGRERLLAVTGLPLQPIFGLCKLRWLKEHEPQAFGRAVRWLNLGDYVAFRLCGAQATDLSLASRTLALDLRRGAWSAELLGAAGVPLGLMAPLVPSGTLLGAVTATAGAETGLPAGCRVAAGGHDHDCGALAAGVTEPGDVLDSLGTAEAIFVPLERPIADLALGRRGYAQGVHVVPGRYYVHGGIYTCGASVAWLQGVVGRTADAELSALLAEAEAVPPGSLGAYFLPYLRLANPPHDDPLARGAFVGLTADTTRGALCRAVLEGLAYESRLSLDTLLAAPG